MEARGEAEKGDGCRVLVRSPKEKRERELGG